MAGGDHFKKVQAGQPLRIAAQTFNAMIDLAREAQASRQSQTTQAARDFRQTGIVLVRNDSGEDRKRFDVLGIDGPLITPEDNAEEFKGRVVLKGAMPALDDHLGRFVVLVEPIREDQIGLAYFDGVCPARVDVEDEEHRFADIKPDDATSLESRDDGAAAILWKEDGQGEKWAVVQLGRRTTPWHFGTVSGDLTAAAPGSVALMNQDPEDGSLYGSGRTVEAYCPLLDSDHKLTSGTLVKVEVNPYSGLWNVTAVDRCPEEIEES